ncbi:MAG: CAAX prenyl protease-related protein, partial [Anaerolineales bacterium]|nr:CAAX prenyl protease-related protein [Anaerolineales bacterium]
RGMVYRDLCQYESALADLSRAIELQLDSSYSYYWRGLVYRWLIGKEFTQIDLGTLRGPILLAVSVCFGLEHDRWLVGIMAGLAYGLLMIRTRDIWAAVTAHGVTNFLLGLYVLAMGAYRFW